MLFVQRGNTAVGNVFAAKINGVDITRRYMLTQQPRNVLVDAGTGTCFLNDEDMPVAGKRTEQSLYRQRLHRKKPKNTDINSIVSELLCCGKHVIDQCSVCHDGNITSILVTD